MPALQKEEKEKEKEEEGEEEEGIFRWVPQTNIKPW
jgi:hypothetical protein